MGSNYKVINTFDRYMAECYGNMAVIRASDNQGAIHMKLRRNPQVLRLPNAPIKAKETLLADCLKSHIPPRQFIDIERRLRRDAEQATENLKAEHNKKIVKEFPGLKGKILGIEIEYYPKNEWLVPKATPLLRCGHDGSLGSGGIEIRKVTWQDKNGRLAGLCNLRLPGRVDTRCGLHVHVDARHIGEPEWCYDRVTECYEPLKLLVPKTRWTSSFCHWVNNREGSDLPHSRPSTGRYAAVNWLAYEEHGSFEFRCQTGMLQPLKIEAWALVCQWLVNWCAHEDHEPPTRWVDFLAIMPEPLRSWCILRARKLHTDPIKKKAKHNDRSDSALVDDYEPIEPARNTAAPPPPPIVDPRPAPPPRRVGHYRHWSALIQGWQYRRNAESRHTREWIASHEAQIDATQFAGPTQPVRPQRPQPLPPFPPEPPPRDGWTAFYHQTTGCWRYHNNQTGEVEPALSQIRPPMPPHRYGWERHFNEPSGLWEYRRNTSSGLQVESVPPVTTNELQEIFHPTDADSTTPF